MDIGYKILIESRKALEMETSKTHKQMEEVSRLYTLVVASGTHKYVVATQIRVKQSHFLEFLQTELTN
jgi:hypothetical protein